MLAIVLLILTIGYFVSKHSTRRKEGYSLDDVDFMGEVIKEKDQECEVITTKDI